MKRGDATLYKEPQLLVCKDPKMFSEKPPGKGCEVSERYFLWAHCVSVAISKWGEGF